jgi:hypothetical protein
MMLNTAVLRPIPQASETIVTAMNAGCFVQERHAYRTSAAASPAYLAAPARGLMRRTHGWLVS